MKLVLSTMVAVLLTACGSSSDSANTSTTTSLATTTTEAPRVESLEIEVTVGENSGDGRIELVDVGSAVSITLVNPAAEDEYHLHGYDIVSKVMPTGVAATMSFTADTVGTFELESHITGEVLLVLEVS